VPQRAASNGGVLFELFSNAVRRQPAAASFAVNGRPVPLAVVRHPRARRYVLRLLPDGSARVTIPRGGSAVAAREFVERNRLWLERQLQRQAARPARPHDWRIGTEIFFRGESTRLAAADDASPSVRLGDELIGVTDAAADLRPAIERHLRRLAAQELPPRVLAFAARDQLPVRRITIRNQRSRWGSCSRRGTISLNWRLIQTPGFVQDYLIWHELSHLKEMNHSARFWREVARVCPGFEAAERWLKEHSSLLR
jgi:predicted metal-dependent hydrolase